MHSRDLAQQHGFVGNTFSMPNSSDQWNRFQLSPDQRAFYRKNGYVSGIRILTDAQVETLREELTVFFDPTHPGNERWHEYHSNESGDPENTLFHALGSWRMSPGFHDILWHPAFTVPAAQLLEGPVRFWHDQLFCKPAKHGGVVAWHQDYSYWTRTRPMAHLSCWIGLDDANPSNGCLQYIPGSHRWDLLPITGLAGDMEGIRKVLTDSQWEDLQSPVAIELKKGEASFHHPLMVHGSRENRSACPRRALVLNAFRDGTLSNSNEAMLQGIPPVPRGSKMEGPFFPLLFDPTNHDLEIKART
ncbi:MAG: phytanoyl-CoA dioxygenase family protein [Verrucomicrobiota bacterium]|nr:phytanoyl-CoA dioxygenase family protein [Verrucomicrobiota bacterium]